MHRKISLYSEWFNRNEKRILKLNQTNNKLHSCSVGSSGQSSPRKPQGGVSGGASPSSVPQYTLTLRSCVTSCVITLIFIASFVFIFNATDPFTWMDYVFWFASAVMYKMFSSTKWLLVIDLGHAPASPPKPVHLFQWLVFLMSPTCTTDIHGICLACSKQLHFENGQKYMYKAYPYMYMYLYVAPVLTSSEHTVKSCY